MNRGDLLWIREDESGPWLEARYEFQCIGMQPLGHHSVMLTNGGGRRVVCGCKTSTAPPALALTAPVSVTRVHRELAYRKLNKNRLPGEADHEGLAWIEAGTDGGPPHFDREQVLAYGIAWGEWLAKAALQAPHG